MTPVALVPSSSSSKLWMHERCFRLVKSAKSDECECILIKTSSPKYERAMKIGKDKKRLKERVLAHHTGLNLISFGGVPSNPGVLEK